MYTGQVKSFYACLSNKCNQVESLRQQAARAGVKGGHHDGIGGIKSARGWSVREL